MTEPMTEQRWYVAKTEPRADRLAEASLCRDDFEVYSPRLKSATEEASQSRVPLFPGYLFVRWDRYTEEWPTFKPEHRVYGFLKFGGEVPWLSNDDIRGLAKRVDEINGDNGHWRRFGPGENVWVDSGGFNGLGEVLEEAKSSDSRALVLLEFMGRKVSAQVPWKNLWPAEFQPAQNQLPQRTSRRTRGRGRWIQGHRSWAETIA